MYLRFNGLKAALGAPLDDSSGEITLAAPLVHAGGAVPAFGDENEYLRVGILDGSGNLAEVIDLYTYDGNVSIGSAGRGVDGTTAVAHDVGAVVVHGAFAGDLQPDSPIGLYSSSLMYAMVNDDSASFEVDESIKIGDILLVFIASEHAVTSLPTATEEVNSFVILEEVSDTGIRGTMAMLYSFGNEGGETMGFGFGGTGSIVLTAQVIRGASSIRSHDLVADAGVTSIEGAEIAPSLRSLPVLFAASLANIPTIGFGPADQGFFYPLEPYPSGSGNSTEGGYALAFLGGTYPVPFAPVGTSTVSGPMVLGSVVLER